MADRIRLLNTEGAFGTVLVIKYTALHTSPHTRHHIEYITTPGNTYNDRLV